MSDEELIERTIETFGAEMKTAVYESMKADGKLDIYQKNYPFLSQLISVCAWSATMTMLSEFIADAGQ